jgi:uncharacterized membrane protein (UPF0182 family)
VRSPADLPVHRPVNRARVAIVVGILAAIVLVASLHGLAVFYTDFLWFRSVGLTQVWSGVLLSKVFLGVLFVAIFFVLCFVNLAIVDRRAFRMLPTGPEDALVQRYRAVVVPHAAVVRSIAALVLALIVGAGVSGEWNNWILFTHAVHWGVKDPVFHKDVGFYVFQLPFLSFLVEWAFAALLVVTLAVAGASYLTGGIRLQGPGPRVHPEVKAHLSVLLALIAVVKAVGYYFQRYELLNANDGFAHGAFYTDLHARLPAIELLIVISLVAAVILLGNIRRQGWGLPIIAIGLWAFISIVVGAIYPAIIENFTVIPSQATKELPYIGRNISATREAMGINGVGTQSFSASQTLTASQVDANRKALSAVRIWDPSLTSATFNKLQDIKGYYTFANLTVNRMDIGGEEQPVVVGVRELDQSQLPAQSWVNTHLQYTHGYGAIVAEASSATSNGVPNFLVQNVPPTSSSGGPRLTQPAVYYGVTDPSYVVANSRQAEFDYQAANGGTVQSHYQGSGGVPAGSVFRRAAFALRFGDLNLLLSSQVTAKSRIMFVRNVVQRVEKAAPFLSFGSNPYAVVLHGGIYWVVNGYTTTDQYPYAQPPNTTVLPASSSLANTSFNYLRNSVKVLVNAYNGKMTFYVTDPSDPIIRAYEKAFPALFTPESAMPAGLAAQLRYPLSLFTLQSEVYGRYHITNPSNFYNASDAWVLAASPAPGAVTSGGGGIFGIGNVTPMTPQYTEIQLPGQSKPSFELLEAFVPYATGSDSQQNLTAFMVAGNGPAQHGPGAYGALTSYVTPRGIQINGPSLVNAEISATPAVSEAQTLLDQHGSSVEQGTLMLVPVDQSLVWVRPLYVQSSQNALPAIHYVVVVYGKTVTLESTLPEAIDATFGSDLSHSTTGPPSSSSTKPVSPSVQGLITQANTDLQQAQSFLQAGNLGGYQSSVEKAQQLLQKAVKLEQAANTKPSATT